MDKQVLREMTVKTLQNLDISPADALMDTSVIFENSTLSVGQHNEVVEILRELSAP